MAQKGPVMPGEDLLKGIARGYTILASFSPPSFLLKKVNNDISLPV